MAPPQIYKMNNYMLIQQIKIRRPLWDKDLWDKIDLSSREAMWEDVAEQMNTKKDIVKNRWKNLRDSYRKLVLKSPGEFGHVTPKWKYFHDLEFIREIVLNTKSRIPDISLRSSPVALIESKDSSSMESVINDAEDPLSIHNDYKPVNACSSTKTIGDVYTEVKVENIEGFKFIDESQNLTEVAAKAASDDDDLQFLLSLHPYLKQVPKNKKLLLRIKMEELVQGELYNCINGINN